jgi:hypothetical protein
MRRYGVFVSLLFFYLTAFPQSEKIRAKIIAGIMGAQIDGDQLSGYNKPGLIAGMAMELPLGKKFALQPEMMYCQKGARSTSTSPYYGVVRLSYLDICSVLNIYLKPRWVIQPGFSYAVLFNAKMDYGSGFADSYSLFHPSDKCWLIGTEFRFTPKTSANIRYSYSLTSIRPDMNWYNNTLSFTLRFSLEGSK